MTRVKTDEYKGIHDGHRERMRDKLLTHGARIFDTYELLEMLLYNVIPYKDTNPIAKSLLTRFGDLSGVLRADPKELTEVSGVGERASELIAAVRELLLTMRDCHGDVRVFDDYDGTGRYLADYFEENPDVQIAMLMLDNGMRMIGMCPIKGDSFGSAGVRARQFIDPAMRASAAIAILAHTHRHGPLFPTSADIATSRMVREELSVVGVNVVEHYVVTGKRFVGVENKLALRFSAGASAELLRFIESSKRGGGR